MADVMIAAKRCAFRASVCQSDRFFGTCSTRACAPVRSLSTIIPLAFAPPTAPPPFPRARCAISRALPLRRPCLELACGMVFNARTHTGTAGERIRRAGGDVGEHAVGRQGERGGHALPRDMLQERRRPKAQSTPALAPAAIFPTAPSRRPVKRSRV